MNEWKEQLQNIFLNNNLGIIVHCRDEHHTVILFCPHCGADLDEQPGFDPDAGYLTCAECGQVLIDPEIDLNDSSRFGQVGWFCDGYCAFLNKQNSSSDWNSIWSCTECGYVNYLAESKIDESEEASPIKMMILTTRTVVMRKLKRRAMILKNLAAEYPGLVTEWRPPKVK